MIKCLLIASPLMFSEADHNIHSTAFQRQSIAIINPVYSICSCGGLKENL